MKIIHIGIAVACVVFALIEHGDHELIHAALLFIVSGLILDRHSHDSE